jgi:hypothetical protein
VCVKCVRRVEWSGGCVKCVRSVEWRVCEENGVEGV